MRLGDWLHAAKREPALAAELLHDAADFKAQLHAAVAGTVTPMAGDQLFVPPILGTSNPALRVPFVNMTQATPVGIDGHSIPSYTNFRYYGETLLAAALPSHIEQAISSFRETHGGTLSGMTRYTDHLDDMPALGYGFSSLLHFNSAKFHGLLFGHLANYHSHGTFFTSEQMSIYGDGPSRDLIHPGCVHCVDTDYCLPAAMLPAFFLKWMLVFAPPDPADELWLAREAPRRWYTAEGFAIERAPTHLGSVSLQVSATDPPSAQGPWVVNARVTVVSPNAGAAGGPNTIQLRMRAPPQAASANASMGTARVVGAQLASQNRSTEMVEITCGSEQEASFSVVVVFS